MNKKRIHSSTTPRRQPVSPLWALALLCLLSSTLSSRAQDWETDITNACRIFTQDAIEIEIEHQFYPTTTGTTPTERQTVWMRRQGENFHLKQYGTQVISNDRYTVIIKDDSQVIGIENKQPSKNQAKTQGWELVTEAFTRMATTLGLDTIQPRKPYTCTYQGETNGSKSYRFDYAYGEYEQSTIYLSAKTGLIEKISTIFRQPQEVEPGIFQKVRIDFVYKKQQSSKKFDKRLFSTDDILTVNAAGEVTLKGKYKNYRLLNHLE
jgi:hypothetical protein